MLIPLRLRRIVAVAAVITTAVTATACSSGDGSASGAPSTGSPTATANKTAAALTAKYTSHPSAFPVDDPLPGRPASSVTIGWLQCVSAVCAQLTGLFRSAASELGVQFIVTKAGASTQGTQSALSSLIEQRPAAILLPSVEPGTVSPQLEQARRQGIKMVATGIMDTASAGIDAGVFGNTLAKLAGTLLADWVAAYYTDAHAVFYTTNELSFLHFEEPAFRAELSASCPGCSERTVDVPIASYGTTAPQLITSDLQKNPSTTIAVFGASAAASGLVAALHTASLHTPFIGYSLTSENLQSIQQGTMAAGLGLDYPVLAWTMVDEAARLIAGKPLTPAEQQQMVPVQWLSRSNLKGDLSKGWTAYPDYRQRFAALWHA